MDLTDASIEPARVHLWGARAVMDIRCPLPGVLRLRHAPSSAAVTLIHPDLPPKQSWAVVADGAIPLSARRDESLVRISAPGVRLEVALPSGAWSFFAETDEQPRARCESVTGEMRSLFPMDRHSVRLSLHAPPGEAYLGFGEKVGTLDKRGMRFTFWNTDNFPPGVATDPLYVSIPFFLAIRDGVAWGLFLDEPWRSEVDVACAHPSRIAWESSGPELDVYLIAGPHPADVVRRYAELTGRPAMPPLWSLGAHQSRWGYERASDIRDVVRGYRERNLPLDVVHLDIDYMDGYKAWTWNPERFPDPAALTRELAAEGVKVVTILDPALKVEEGYAAYEEAKKRGYLVRLDRGEVLVGEVWPDPAVFPDFTRQEVRRFWGDLHAPHLALGVAGVWNDMNEPACFSIRETRAVPSPSGGRQSGTGTVVGSTLPYEAWHGDRRHLEMHNVYGLAMARAAFEGMTRHAPDRRPFILTRAAYAGIQRFAAVWTGDFSSHFTHLEASIPMLVGLGLSGVPFAGADVPGFLGDASGELFTRWLQAGLFYPLLRNHGSRGSAPREPWRFGEPFLSFARATLERRYRLLPALYTAMREAADAGLPVMRPLAFLDPSDPEALSAFDQFLFGEHLLVAPVVRPGQTKRLAYLPAGAWLDFANLEPRGTICAGRRHLIAYAPLDVVPVWLREGSALPLGVPRAHTTTANWPEITWHVHAAATVNGRLYEDEGDGDGPSRITEIHGGTSGATFILERRVTGALPLARASETLCIHGLPPPRAVSGAFGHRVDAGTIELHVDAGWERIELSL